MSRDDEIPMNQSKVSALLVMSAVALLVAGCAAPASRNDEEPSIERLQSAQVIEVAIMNLSNGTQHKVSIADPVTLSRVRVWVERHAWPPIDLLTTGNVAPRGIFTVYDRASEATRSFEVYVYAATTRTKPQVVHVSDEDCQTLLSLIPPR